MLDLARKNAKYFICHKVNEAARISIILALSQIPVYIVRPQIWPIWG